MAYVAAASAVVSLIGTAVSAYSSYQQGQAQQAQMRYQAKVAENNALAQQYEADYVKEKAVEDARKQRRLTAQAVAEQRARMGSSGVVADEGTFLDLTLDTAEQGKLDELAILRNADIEAWRYTVGVNNSRAQAGLYEMGASSINPGLNAAGTLMTGVGNVGMSYSAFNSAPKTTGTKVS